MILTQEEQDIIIKKRQSEETQLQKDERKYQEYLKYNNEKLVKKFDDLIEYNETVKQF